MSNTVSTFSRTVRSLDADNPIQQTAKVTVWHDEIMNQDFASAVRYFSTRSDVQDFISVEAAEKWLIGLAYVKDFPE